MNTYFECPHCERRITPATMHVILPEFDLGNGRGSHNRACVDLQRDNVTVYADNQPRYFASYRSFGGVALEPGAPCSIQGELTRRFGTRGAWYLHGEHLTDEQRNKPYGSVYDAVIALVRAQTEKYLLDHDLDTMEFHAHKRLP